MTGITREIHHKYHAKRTENDGISFSSKKEAAYYERLKFLQRSGQIVFFLRQVPFDIGGGVKYRADFMIFWSDGKVTVVDVKGLKLPDYIAKKKIVESLYPIEIEEV